MTRNFLDDKNKKKTKNKRKGQKENKKQKKNKKKNNHSKPWKHWLWVIILLSTFFLYRYIYFFKKLIIIIIADPWFCRGLIFSKIVILNFVTVCHCLSSKTRTFCTIFIQFFITSSIYKCLRFLFLNSEKVKFINKLFFGIYFLK